MRPPFRVLQAPHPIRFGAAQGLPPESAVYASLSALLADTSQEPGATGYVPTYEGATHVRQWKDTEAGWLIVSDQWDGVSEGQTVADLAATPGVENGVVTFADGNVYQYDNISISWVRVGWPSFVATFADLPESPPDGYLVAVTGEADITNAIVRYSELNLGWLLERGYSTVSLPVDGEWYSGASLVTSSTVALVTFAGQAYEWTGSEWQVIAAPAVLSYPATLDIGDNPSATITFDNVSADKSGCGITLAIGSPFTVSPTSFGPLAPAGSAVITVSTSATGAQSDTLTATGSDGPISIPVTSAYSYLPGSIAGYLADYDAKYQPVVADDTTLTSVLDRGPNGYNTTGVTQSPKYRTGANGINGFPCFRFDHGGNNAFFDIPVAIRSAIGTAGQGEYFAVVTAVADANCGEPLGIGDGNQGLYPFQANNIYSSFASSSQRQLGTIGVSPITTPHVMGISHSGTALFSYTDGTQRGTALDTLAVGTSYCRFPNRYANTASFKGKIGQLIIYNRRLTTQERTDVVDFLKTVWGI